MSTTTKAPKIDFFQWTKEEELRPRTLRELAAEVGFPFAAKAVAETKKRSEDTEEPLSVGEVVRISGPSSWRPGSYDSDIYREGWALPLSIAGDVPRWILLGDRT